MSNIFPEIEVGEALEHRGLAVFPLYTKSAEDLDYQVAVAALESGQVSVEEVDNEGTVPHLLVTNTGDTKVFFMEGEELTGGKQNRVMNTSVLAGSKSSVRIPVSCVEAGRWGYGGFNRAAAAADGGTKELAKLGSDLNCFSGELRQALRDSVMGSLRRKRGHSSSQEVIWDEIEKEQKELRVRSSTHAMKDTYEGCRARLDEFKANLKYPDEAVGLVGIIDGEIISFDLFDKTSTCESFWSRLVASYTLSRLKKRVLLAAAGPQGEFDLPDVEGFIEAARSAPWQSHKAVGEGVEYRARTEDGMEGFALQYDGKLVHGSLLVRSK